jgi:uncharacterized protein YegP (UPF0339 family)
MSDTALLYRDDDGEFRWVRTSANGDVVGASTEGYSRKIDARENYLRTNGVEAPELVEEDVSGAE